MGFDQVLTRTDKCTYYTVQSVKLDKLIYRQRCGISATRREYQVKRQVTLAGVKTYSGTGLRMILVSIKTAVGRFYGLEYMLTQRQPIDCLSSAFYLPLIFLAPSDTDAASGDWSKYWAG